MSISTIGRLLHDRNMPCSQITMTYRDGGKWEQWRFVRNETIVEIEMPAMTKDEAIVDAAVNALNA